MCTHIGGMIVELLIMLTDGSANDRASFVTAVMAHDTCHRLCGSRIFVINLSYSALAGVTFAMVVMSG